MTAEPIPAGAASHREVDWHSIDWQQVNQNVRRLQARIVKATQEGRWGKVKALQRLLTHSFSGKALAVRRVTENHGKRTPGVDKETWPTPEKKAAAVVSLRQHGYQPMPLRRVYIPKKNGKRPLGIPTMRDRAMQALYLLALDPIAETTGDSHSYGFRPQRSTADAAQQCHILLSRPNGPQWILEGDIKSCFDRISHDWLLAHVPMDKAVLRKWLKAGFMENSVLYATEEGTPQGGIASPVLANLALDGLEARLREIFPRTTEGGRRALIHLVRYADDFIITGRTKELLEEQVTPLVEAFLRERGLALSQEKTHITHIEDGFDFLGFNVRKYNGKLIIKPSKKSRKAFLDKVRDFIRANPTLPAGKMVVALNPIIRGWVNYHRHVAAKRIFNTMDHTIFKALWRWAKRRHHNKPSQWVKDKYFTRRNGKDWVFHGECDGQQRYLAQAYDMPIRRHVKVKAAANPYDRVWEVYFEERLGVKMAATLHGRRQLLYLWKEQNGVCPVCHQQITRLTGWHNHHIIRRVDGGSDTATNRVLLHPTCHRQLHSRGLYVEKPRPRGDGREA